MANIKDLKEKIRSTKGTLKITTAMKLVSAAKLNKAQIAITSSKPYAEELEDTINVVSTLVKDYDHSFFHEKQSDKSLLLVISGTKGLCGAFNSQVVKETRKFLSETKENFEVSFVGKKAKEVLEKEITLKKYYSFEKNEPTFVEFKNVIEEIVSDFEKSEYKNVYLIYNQFNSAISFTTKLKQVLPISLIDSDREKIEKDFPYDFKYEPSPKVLLDTLVPETLLTSLWTAQLDALASEHGSRMAAMDSASTNCKEMVQKLTLKMNKLRQAAITTELIEVVSGAESLKG